MYKLLLTILAVFMLVNSAEAQNKAGKILTAEELYSLQRVSEMSTSPDGKWVVYKIGKPDLKDNKIYGDLWVVGIDGKGTKQLTNDKSSEYNPVWSPDSKKIAYISNKDGAPQIYVMDFASLTTKKITTIANGVSNIAWSPDGKHISFTSDVKIDKTPKDLYPEYDKANIRIYDKLPVRHWDEWVDENYSHLFIIPADGGTALDVMPNEAYDTPLKPFGGAEEIAWSNDGKEIAYTCKKMIGLEFVQNTNSQIYVYSLDNKTTKIITEEHKGYDKAPLYSPDGKWIAFFSMEHNGFESDKNRLMLYNRQTGKSFELPKNLDQWAEEKVWSADSKNLYIAATDSGVVNIFEVNAESGNWKRLTNTTNSCGGGLNVTPNGTLVFGVQGIFKPLDIYTMSVKGGKMTQLTDANPNFAKDYKEVKYEARWFTAKDGKKIHAWVIYPPDFDANKKYPMMTYCQGGPQSMVSSSFHYRWNFAMMASHGYVIVAPNRRGVPGFGQEWNNAISGDWGGMPMQDLLSATDEMAKEKYIDTKGLCAIGASAGGYTAYWMAGNHNKRFAALMAHCGVFNLESMYGATEELWFPNWEYGGPYWEKDNMKFYDKNSPHNFVKNWDTPIIISTGEHDFRVPYTQSLEAFTAAQVKGLPSKLLSFPEETHFISRCQEFIIWDKEVFKFLDTYCKKK